MAYAAALPTLTREWAMTASDAGFVQTCFFTGFAVSLFFTSWFSDRIGAKRVFLVFCWLSALASLAFALYARSYTEALWLYALVGVSQGGTYIPAIMLVSQKLPSERRGGGVGWILASMSAGYVGSISLSAGFTATRGLRGRVSSVCGRLRAGRPVRHLRGQSIGECGLRPRRDYAGLDLSVPRSPLLRADDWIYRPFLGSCSASGRGPRHS